MMHAQHLLKHLVRATTLPRHLSCPGSSRVEELGGSYSEG